VATLGGLLARVEPGEVAVCVGLLSGVPRQGRIGIGYASVYGLEITPAAGPSLAVEDLDHVVDAIRADVGPGSATRRRMVLAGLLGAATEPEATFIKRLLTGELRQGALAGLMADAIARAAGVSTAVARRALMLSGDLTRMAEIAMADGEDGLRAAGLELFCPVLPMLAAPGETVAQAMAAFACSSVEFELDGLRVQIHRRDDEIRIYSRNLNDITGRLPSVVDAVRRLPVRDVILDGEALWMGESGPASFQETMSQIDTDAPPEGVVTFLFDVLHVDGRDLLDAPLRERSAELRRVAADLVVPSVITDDVVEGEWAFADRPPALDVWNACAAVAVSGCRGWRGTPRRRRDHRRRLRCGPYRRLDWVRRRRVRRRVRRWGGRRSRCRCRCSTQRRPRR
jgi:DNA ligase-1